MSAPATLTDLSRGQARALDRAVDAGWSAAMLLEAALMLDERGYTLAFDEREYSGADRAHAREFLRRVSDGPVGIEHDHGWFRFRRP